MALTVVVRSGDLSSLAQITFDAPRVVIGRGEGSEVRLPDPSVSHRHASIRQRGPEYTLIDEGSTNGTFVGSVRLSPHAPRVLRSGDLIRVGRVWLEVKIEVKVPTTNAVAATKEIALMLVASSLASDGKRTGAKVTVRGGADLGRELVIAEFDRVYTVGRSGSADLPLADEDVSRNHVGVYRRGLNLYVRDLDSKNGTALGGERLLPNKDTPWLPGMLVRLGNTQLAYEDPLLETLNQLEHYNDEAIPDDEPVVMPEALQSKPPMKPAPAPAALPVRPPANPQGGNSAPIAEVPRGVASPMAQRRSGLRLADLLIGIVALVVLGVSLIGLAWLFRGN